MPLSANIVNPVPESSFLGLVYTFPFPFPYGPGSNPATAWPDSILYILLPQYRWLDFDQRKPGILSRHFLAPGLNPRPLSLVAHFFAVPVYGIGRLILPFPSPKRIWIGARLLRVRPLSYFFRNSLILSSALFLKDLLWQHWSDRQPSLKRERAEKALSWLTKSLRNVDRSRISSRVSVNE